MIALPEIELTVECRKCGHPVWFLFNDPEEMACTDCGTVNTRHQPEPKEERSISLSDADWAVIEYVLTNAKATSTGRVGEDVRAVLKRVREQRS